jgi:hypothetical protein
VDATRWPPDGWQHEFAGTCRIDTMPCIAVDVIVRRRGDAQQRNRGDHGDWQ